MTIGENIKLKRKEQGITQEKLAKYIGKSLRTIQKYESNDITPNIQTLTKIAEALNISLNTLLKTNDIDAMEVYELTQDLLNYISELALINNPEEFLTPNWSIVENKFFKKFCGFKRPKDNMFNEEQLTIMLLAVLESDLEEFIRIFSTYYKLILLFSISNLKTIDSKLNFFNLSLEQLKSDLFSNNPKNYNNSIDCSIVLTSLQTVLNYIKNTSNQKVLKNLLDYNLNSEKQLVNEILHCLEEKLLIHAINKGDLSIKINSIEGDNNDNKKS